MARKFASSCKRKRKQQKKHKKSLILIELQFTVSINKKKYCRPNPCMKFSYC